MNIVPFASWSCAAKGMLAQGSNHGGLRRVKEAAVMAVAK